MIYVSTSCVKANTISKAIKILVNEGYKNIELSGGTNYYEGIIDDLVKLKEDHSLNYILHNYFPPPKDNFVLNIASLNFELHSQSMQHIKNAIDISKILGTSMFAFHAGFRLDIPVSQIGKKIKKFSLFPESSSMKKFCDSYEELREYAGRDFQLYIENNVFSRPNSESYSEECPFFLLNLDDFKELKEKIDFKLLLDVAHLKVSCNTLKLNFSEQFAHLCKVTNYLHVSDNDGLQDLNYRLTPNSELTELLSCIDIENKIVTLEVYEGLEQVRQSFDILSNLGS